MRSVEDRNREYAERDARDARRAKELEPLGLTKREYHALQGAGVNGLNDLPRISVIDLLKVPQCGTGTVKGICRKLEANGIRLSGPYIHEFPARLTLEQERDQLRAKVEALRKAAVPRELYTCVGKGGEYELLGRSLGAGERRLDRVVVYRDTETGLLYHRTLDDFDARMALLEGGAE